MELLPSTARIFWKALMENATSLIADADALLERRSYGRARSLTVLAQEELGKALWLYETFSESWNTDTDDALEVPRLAADGRRHAVKYMEAFVYGQDLPAFWGDYDSYEPPAADSPEGWKEHFAEKKREAESAGKRANDEKMAGFYADLAHGGDAVSSPADIESGTIAEDLQTAAQVVEMLLIADHSRMKFDAVTSYDSTHAEQFKLLPLSHPEDWSAASEQFRNGGAGAEAEA